MARMLWCAVMLVLPMAAFADSRVATPTFSVAGGEHHSVVMVVVRVKTPGATIRLTQNGLDPTESDPIVVSGSTIAVNTSLILKARAYLHGRRPSDVRTAAFTITSAGPAIGPGDAAAGGGRSILAIPDGHVFEWRRNTPPAIVAGLSNVTAVAVGRHVMALIASGDVYTWGANNFGQLGDGTNVPRERPTRVVGLGAVVRIAAGRTHSLALTADGRVWAWGSNSQGQLGMAAPQQVRVPTRIATLSDIVAIDAGDVHSVAVTRAGDIFAWGANNHGQLGDGTRKKRAQPIRISLTAITQVAAGATHTLAVAQDGSVYSWGSGARGELGTGSWQLSTRPVAITALRAYTVRAGRHFSAAIRHDGALVTWGANDAGQLGDGSHVDRATPVVGPALSSISALALGGRHAIVVTATGDVWTWGRNSALAEAMSDVADWGPPIAPEVEPPPTDTTPPTIVVDVSPPAPGGGWHTTPVTVSFRCADDSGTVSCPAPIVVSTDGASQLISGTATDPAGHQATATVAISVDQIPPSIALTNSPDRTMTTAPQQLLTGNILDSVSGPADTVFCNGSAVLVFEQAFECLVALEPGVNNILIGASDTAGNAAAVTLVITRVVTSGTLRLTPDARTMLVGDAATLSLRDHAGAEVTEAAWASSDSAVVALSDTDPPLVIALAPGTAVIVATKDTSTAAATVTVDPGDVLAPGTVRWTIAPTPGFTMEPPIFTHRVDLIAPDMFIVETQASGATTLLRAVTSEGELLWQQPSPGIPLMGDSFGGVIAGEPYIAGFRYPFKALVRVGTAGGVTPWRYESEVAAERPAQADDGTIYVVDNVEELDANGLRLVDKHVIVLDGRTGQVVARYPLAREVSTNTCGSLPIEQAPTVAGPIVGSDGRAYLLVRRRQRHALCDEGTTLPPRTIENGVDLMILSRGTPPSVREVYSEQCNIPRDAREGCDRPPTLQQVVPDGIGGVLLVWQRGAVRPNGTLTSETMVSRLDAEGGMTRRPVPGDVRIDRVGQNGIVYTSDEGTFNAIDATTWTQTWTATFEDGGDLVAAHPDGGAALYSRGAILVLGNDGQVSTPAAGLGLSLPVVQEFNSWIGLRHGQLHVLAGDFPDATRFAALASGNLQQQSSVHKPGLGIFLKSHRAEPGPFGVGRYRHLSVRVTPRNQEREQPQSSGHDAFGNWYFTIGAGPVGADSACSGNNKLTGGLNRSSDVTIAPYDPLERLHYTIADEEAVIGRLLTAFGNYDNDLAYACFPENNDGFYNSNSYAAGLINAAGLSVVGLPVRVPRLFPGVRKPVPLDKFK